MIVKKGSDWKRYIVNCKEEHLFDKIKQIAKKGGKILGWTVCPELQAIMHDEYEVDIWVEVVKPKGRDKIIQNILSKLDEIDTPTDTTS